MEKTPKKYRYEDIIQIIALLRIVPSKALNHLFNNDASRANFLNKAKDNKHIKIFNDTITNKLAERRAVTYIQITEKGLIYLADKGSDLFEQAISTHNLAIFTNAEIRQKARKKLGDISTATIMSYSAGANIPINTFGSMRDEESGDAIFESTEYENQKEYSLKHFYNENITSDLAPTVFQNQCDSNANDYLIFYTSGYIKNYLAGKSAKGNYRDFMSGRYTGILDSKQKSLMLFCAPWFTMPWSDKLTKAESRAYDFWTHTSALTDYYQQKETQRTAALIVNNAREFAYHYNTFDRANKKTDVFGGVFDHMYIIPNSEEGVRLLQWLMFNTDQQISDTIVGYSLESGQFSEDQSVPMFPLLNHRGEKTAVGLSLDAKQIKKIETYVRAHGDQAFQILCLDWQEDYYSRVMPPNVNYRSFPSDILL